MMKIYLGRHVFGLAAIVFAVITLVWREFSTWQQNVPHHPIFVYGIAVVELLGGLAIQWTKTVRLGAVVLGCLYLAFALSWVPRIIAEPLVYDRWGNFFEQFSIVSGALIVFGMSGPGDSQRPTTAARFGYFFFAICVVSFTFEQLFYLSGTASFVPKWIPPGQMFWAIATTIFFALAAVALFSGRFALRAARLLTIMIVGFGLLIWLPAPFRDPHRLINWGGNAQNLAILGAAWIVADFLAAVRANQGIAQSEIPAAAGHSDRSENV